MENSVHCFFEQSGTFKKSLKRYFKNVYDYDIKNDFGETDFVIDLFSEIEKAYNKDKSIFDNILEDDLIFAFFPCTRFEAQIQLHFRGEAYQQINKSNEEKLELDLKLHQELAKNYEIITKLTIVCLRKNIRLIIENPMGGGTI